MIKKYIRSTQAKSIFVLLLFLFIGFAIYSNTFRSPFVFDDLTAITGNPNGRLKELSWEGLSKVLNGAAANRPVPMLSFALNYFFNQYRVVGYHAVNILIHVTNGFLLFLFVRTTVDLSTGDHPEKKQKKAARSGSIAFFCSMLWLVHPLQTQSVTYIYQRMTSLAALFFLSSLLCYVMGRKYQLQAMAASPSAQPINKPTIICFVGSAILGLLALGSKENTATLPFFIILYEWCFFQNQRGGWLRKKTLWIILASLPGLVLFWITISLVPSESHFANVSRWDFFPAARLLTSSRVLVYYLSLLVIPHPSRLNLDYDFPFSSSLTEPWTTVPSLILIFLFAGLALYSIRRHRLLFFCISWFFGNLVIESTVIPLKDIIFEHRLYLPSMLLLPPLLVYIEQRIKKVWIPGLIICLIAITFSYWTVQRNQVWQSEMALWTDIVNKSPNKARPHNNLGLAYQNQGNIEKAIFHYKTASQLDRTNYLAYNNQGNIYLIQGNLEKAYYHLSEALRLKPDNLIALNNMGRYFYLKGDFDTAMKQYFKVLEKNPLNEIAHNNVAGILMQKDRMDEAKHHLLRSMKINPQYADPVVSYGNMLVRQNQPQKGQDYLQRALIINPTYHLAHFSLGNLFLNTGQLENAIRHFQKALLYQPELAMAHNNLAVAYEGKGLNKEAADHYRRALTIDPKFAAARKNLDELLSLGKNSRDKVQPAELGIIRQSEDLSQKRSKADKARAYFEMGNRLLRQGDLQKASQHFLVVIDLEPGHIEAYNNLGVVRFKQGRNEDAREAFQKVLEIDPGYEGAKFNLDRISGLTEKSQHKKNKIGDQ